MTPHYRHLYLVSPEFPPSGDPGGCQKTLLKAELKLALNLLIPIFSNFLLPACAKTPAVHHQDHLQLFAALEQLFRSVKVRGLVAPTCVCEKLLSFDFVLFLFDLVN